MDYSTLVVRKEGKDISEGQFGFSQNKKEGKKKKVEGAIMLSCV